MVGLTGGIGSGKTTALQAFAALGAHTVSADTLVHEAYDLPEVRRAVVAWLGESYLHQDGSVNRRMVAQQIFAHPEQRTFLERFLHPLVRQRMDAFIERAPQGAIVVAEVPLLFEARQEQVFDGLFHVTVALGAGSEARRARTLGRFSDQDFASRERAQVSDEHRRELADYFFVNEGAVDDLRAWVAAVWSELQSRRQIPQSG